MSFFNFFCDVFKDSVAAYLCICFLFSSCDANVPNPSVKENKFLISNPVLNLHEECSEDSPYVSQGVYGHSARLVKEMADGWAMIEIEDGYQGYGLVEGLIQDDPRWRTRKRSVRVSAVTGIVYPIADTERPALMKLPFGSRVELLEDLDSNEDRWLEVQLADGRNAWIQRGDLEKPRTKNLEEVIQLSYKFLERPYVWGGNSSEGFDCSGILLVDAYQAKDDWACEDNNTSAFCSRPITGSSNEWSYHSFGLAIDINPLLNPYQKDSKVVPLNGQQFLDRTIDCHGVIDEEDPCYKAFISRGWKWGGHWAKERGYVLIKGANMQVSSNSLQVQIPFQGEKYSGNINVSILRDTKTPAVFIRVVGERISFECFQGQYSESLKAIFGSDIITDRQELRD